MAIFPQAAAAAVEMEIASERVHPETNHFFTAADSDHDGDMDSEMSLEGEDDDFDDAASTADYVDIETRVLAGRWQCDLCCDVKGLHDTPWDMQGGLIKCTHRFCRDCVRGLVSWDPRRTRCPFDGARVTSLVECGVMRTPEFVDRIKQKRAFCQDALRCSSPDCVGIVHAVDSELPVQSRCDVCAAAHCGRRPCAAPWQPGHRCPDILSAEHERERLAAERESERLRRDNPSIDTRIRQAPRFQTCPRCGVMVEHDGGCNMMRHDCGASWCFICQRTGTCSDFNCRAPMQDRSDGSTKVAMPSSSLRVRTEGKGLDVDVSRTLTRVRVTFHDGTVEELDANADQTVGDLLRFCSCAVGHVPMQILAGFPPRVLPDESMTLEAAGLLNASVKVRPCV